MEDIDFDLSWINTNLDDLDDDDLDDLIVLPPSKPDKLNAITTEHVCYYGATRVEYKYIRTYKDDVFDFKLDGIHFSLRALKNNKGHWWSIRVLIMRYWMKCLEECYRDGQVFLIPHKVNRASQELLKELEYGGKLYKQQASKKKWLQFSKADEQKRKPSIGRRKQR